ncbi:PH-interacting protein-like [Limulus polyphemus]|uniref:PH-interacting protein-like n=1 Tax=Limulus polyphemus TaxID=6850 RepID=A0ABM1B9L9_LIMPO|nr:PH-interacting protein-like [Limulus polyphemus]
MSDLIKEPKKTSSLEAELYYLIANFLNSGPCKRSAEILRQEIEKYQLMPCRIDWLGRSHQRSFEDLEQNHPHISHDHLLKICSRLGPVLDKEVPSSVPGVQTLLGAGRQSMLRTKQNVLTPKWKVSEMTSCHHGRPFLPPHYAESSYPPNIVYGLYTREANGSMKCHHLASSRIYSKQQLYRRMLGHLSSVYCVLFDRTGKYIFTGADDTLVKIWSSWDGRLLSSLRGHSAEITDMAITYDNSLLAASSVDKMIRVWCLKTTAPVAVLTGHTGMVTSLQFCPYPKGSLHYLISTGNDGCVCFWQWNTNTTNVFNPKPLKFTERNRAGAQMICSSFSSGGVFLATGSTDHHVRVYNILGNGDPEKIMELEGHSDRVDSLQFSNKSSRFISGSKDGTARIWWYERQKWNTICLKMTTKLPGFPTDEGEDIKLKLRVTMVGWSLDDSLVITAVSDHSIKVWESQTGTLKHVLDCHEDEVFVLETHPRDQRLMLSAGHDGRIVLWDIMSGIAIKSFFNTIERQGHGAVFDCKFSPDGLMFASTDSHGHLSIFGLGSSERYKKVPEEQFFHTDYRPLIRDTNQHVLDEQTQCAPHLMPPPFLVDIDGNPYPPNLQRLVPGRENCNESQLIPYIAVSAEGQAEILEPIRPVEADQQRPTIDDMIERLQQEQNSRRVNPSRASGAARESERNVQGPISPRVLGGQRSLSGHSRVGMRRNGDIEGVRQSSGNWQSRGQFSGSLSWLKRVVVKPMCPPQIREEERFRQMLADQELSHFNGEKRKKPISETKEEETDSVKLKSQRCGTRKQQQQQNMRTRLEQNISYSESSDSSDIERRNWRDSSSEEAGSESEEYSDWTADAGVSLDSFKKKSKSGKHRAGEEDHKGEESQTRDEDEKKTCMKKQNKRKNRRIKEVPDEYKPPEWLTHVVPQKNPYVPQVGDEVLYFWQGHEIYLKAVKKTKIYDVSLKSQPFRKLRLREQELVRIEDIEFEILPPRLCHLRLAMIDPETGDCTGDSFTLKYHNMDSVPDFLVLRYYYNVAMDQHWKAGDRFRCMKNNTWQLGTIDHQEPLQEEYPDCMFQCFFVKLDNQEMERLSPWDLEPLIHNWLRDRHGQNMGVAENEQIGTRYSPKPSEWPKCGQEEECSRLARGLEQIMELAIAEPFTVPVDLNLYPDYALVVEYPVDLSTIKARLENHFYSVWAPLALSEPVVSVLVTDFKDYRDIIDHPVDLSTVKERLQTGHYNTPVEFCKDMRLIFQNSRNYNTNKRSRIYGMTIRLSAMFEEHIRAITSDWRSAVKYEEKMRNNKYASNRRKPLPLAIADWLSLPANHPALRAASSSSQQEPLTVRTSHNRGSGSLDEAGPSSSNGGEISSKRKKGTLSSRENEKRFNENNRVTSFSKTRVVTKTTHKRHLGIHMSNGFVKKSRSLRSSTATSRRENSNSVLGPYQQKASSGGGGDSNRSEDEIMSASNRKLKNKKNINLQPNNDHRYKQRFIGRSSKQNSSKSDLTDVVHMKHMRWKSTKRKSGMRECSNLTIEMNTGYGTKPNYSAFKSRFLRKRKFFSDSKPSSDINTYQNRFSKRCSKRRTSTVFDEATQSGEENYDEVILKRDKNMQKKVRNFSNFLKTEQCEEMTSVEEECEGKKSRNQKRVYCKKQKNKNLVKREKLNETIITEVGFRTGKRENVRKSNRQPIPLEKYSTRKNEGSSLFRNKLRSSRSQNSTNKYTFSEDLNDKDSSNNNESTSNSSKPSGSSGNCSGSLDCKSDSKTSCEYQKITSFKDFANASKNDIRRSSRTATRNSTKATRSALTSNQSVETPSRRSRRMCNKTVDYQEETDQDYVSSQSDESEPSQLRETLSESNHCRMHKLTSHIRPVVAE